MSVNHKMSMLRAIARLFGCVSRDEMRGAHLDLSRPHWEVNGSPDFPSLFKALGQILPAGCILYFEGGTPAGDVQQFLASASVPEKTHIAYGTIWPRPQVFHVPATEENLSELAGLMEKYPPPVLAVHFHIYKDDEVFIEWHDAFDNPMFLSKAFSAEQVAAFCRTLCLNYNEQPGMEDPRN